MSANKHDNTRLAVAEIWTEGKTDWRILKRALQVLDIDLPITFHESDKDMGGTKLRNSLQTFSDRKHDKPLIFIFDRDEQNIVTQVSGIDTPYRDWGNNVFSFAIPVPSHRQGHENISIEKYFTDDEIQRKDSHGRQLFLTSSFHEDSGKHQHDPTIHCARPTYLKGCTAPERAKIIDAEVFDARNCNIALSKTDFAENVTQAIPPFDNLNFQEFNRIFAIVQQIIQCAVPEHNIYHPDLSELPIETKILEPAEQFPFVFRRICDILSLALQIFSITTIRVYEEAIINEPVAYRKRVTPIKKIVTEAFRKPGLGILTQLAQKCYYLTDDEAPIELRVMKDCLGQTLVLGYLGQMWDDLETLFTTDTKGPRIVNKPNIQRDFLQRLMPEIAQYADKPRDVIEQGLCGAIDVPSVQISTWEKALLQVVELLQPIFSHPVVFRSVSLRDPSTDELIIEVRTYSGGCLNVTSERIQRDDEYQRKSSELVLADNLRIHLYPLLLIRDDALFFYRRTMPSGYEYYSIRRDETHIESTKKKFSQALFQVGSKQELFWTDVLPKRNELSGITANIPDEGPYEFIGRRKQINQIKEEIISIVNENGIIYGLGGIGKTVLMIQLSKELYAEEKKENVLYDNIVWVSAKRDFYDYIFDTVEKREPQVRSLDNILLALLKFFDLGDLEEYSFEDHKELTLELLNDTKILLIIDNFESIKQPEAIEIIDFFGTEVKKSLRHKPANFKVILTSRELVPSGFRQIELEGLDLRDSKRLMNSLFKRYKSTHTGLSDSQKKTLHEQTKGIPILIKHCFARIYEYQEPFNAVVRGLPSYSSKIVQFSFKEILEQLEKETNQIPLQVLILLEIADMPLMIRQMADILQVEEHGVEKGIPLLAGFECIKRINQDNQEKYHINDDIRLLTKSLVQKHRDLARDIRQRYYRNFTFDKQLDYTSVEEEIIAVFEGYLKQRQFADAEDFIRMELKKRPTSVLLNYYYARYLKERRNETDAAIEILEGLRGATRNHPTVLKLLFACYASSSIPKFERADNLITQIQSDLGAYLEQDLDLQMEIARFYTRWSVSIKLTRGIDPFEENIRQDRYKELARKALDILLSIESERNQWNTRTRSSRLSEVYYCSSQCYYNLWNYDQALKLIDKAISLASDSLNYAVEDQYVRFRRNILSTKEFYERNPGLDQRR